MKDRPDIKAESFKSYHSHRVIRRMDHSLVWIIVGVVFLLLVVARGLGLSGWGPEWLVRFTMGKHRR